MDVDLVGGRTEVWAGKHIGLDQASVWAGQAFDQGRLTWIRRAGAVEVDQFGPKLIHRPSD